MCCVFLFQYNYLSRGQRWMMICLFTYFSRQHVFFSSTFHILLDLYSISSTADINFSIHGLCGNDDITGSSIPCHAVISTSENGADSADTSCTLSNKWLYRWIRLNIFFAGSRIGDALFNAYYEEQRNL